MPRLTATAIALAAVACLLLGCGESGKLRLSPQGVQRVAPPSPQLLAFVAGTRIGVLEGGQVRYVGRVAPGESVGSLSWSGDGRRLAWTASDSEDYENRLEMVDLHNGVRHTWPDVAGAPDPGLRGVVVATYHSRFIEYLPDGRRRGLPVRLPRPDDAIAETSGTTVNAVLPFGRRWLVLAEHTSVVGRGGPVRGFLFDPQRAELEQIAVGTGFAAEPARIGPDRAVWIERRAGSACLSADEIGAYGISVPSLPQRDDERTWAIRRLFTGAAGIDVLARGTGQLSGGCDSDPSYSWLSLRDDRWSRKENGLLDLDLAADGRIARVTGRVCDEGEGCLTTGYLSVAIGEANVETSAGAPRALPSNTTQVTFSPTRSAAVPDYAGDGPPLELGMPLESDGFGPLRLGMTAAELQAATSTPLTFRLDDAGCGTFEPSDLLTAERLGVEGALREGRLVALRVTTLEREPEDEDEDYEPDPLSDLQPGVGSVAARGPRTERGLRVGDPVGMMLELYGSPAARTVPGPTDAVDYTYETDGGTLLLHADGAGVLRRLEFRAGPAAPC